MDLGNVPKSKTEYLIFITLNCEVGYSQVNPPPPPPHLLIKRGTSFLEPFQKVKWGIK